MTRSCSPVQGTLHVQGPGSGRLEESSKDTWAGQCTASHQDGPHWHLCAGTLTPHSPPREGRRAKKELPECLAQQGERGAPVQCQQSSGTPQPLREPGNCPESCWPLPRAPAKQQLWPIAFLWVPTERPRCPQCPGCGWAQGRQGAAGAGGEPCGQGPAPLCSAHPHPDPGTAPGQLPTPCPGPWEANSPLAFPAAPVIALTGKKHLIFQETDRERMLVSLSS